MIQIKCLTLWYKIQMVHTLFMAGSAPRGTALQQIETLLLLEREEGGLGLRASSVTWFRVSGL